MLYQQSPLYLTRAQFEQSLAGWEFDFVLRKDNTLALVFLVKGPEFHFAKFGNDLQVTREHLKKYPGSLLAKYGYALTKTPKTDQRQQRFNERLGFFRIGEDEFDIHYRIENSIGKPPCQY